MCDLSIIIVSWNTLELTRNCLTSIMSGCINLSTEIFVVDNASSDGSPEMVLREFPGVSLLHNDNNLGFAKANNAAIREAAGKYICLINSDVIVLPNCVQTMFAFLEENIEVGIIGPKMITPCGKPGPSCMRMPTLGLCASQAFGLHRFSNRFELHINNYFAESAQDVAVLNGWFWMVRTLALESVGLLDERFFMFGEDIDWCSRFWKHQWKVVYLPTASSIHLSGGSSARDPVRFYIQLQQARLQFWKCHYNKLSQCICWFIMTLHQLVRLLVRGFYYITLPKQRVITLQGLTANIACLISLLGIRFSARVNRSGSGR